MILITPILEQKSFTELLLILSTLRFLFLDCYYLVA